MMAQPHLGKPGLQFGILGALRIDFEGDDVPLRSPKQRDVLAALLIEGGEVVPTDRLAEIVWGGAQPDDPPATIHTYVSRLRKLFERWGGVQERDLLVTRPRGYALRVDPGRVDAGRFEHLLGVARAASVLPTQAELAGEALALWRGPALMEFDHAQAAAEAARLEELREEAFELRAHAMLSVGRHREVVAELEVPVARNPLRESLRGHLMVALYRCGRQADALAAYRDLRDLLVGQLGVEPSAALRELERAILQQAEELPWPVLPAGAPTGDGRWTELHLTREVTSGVPTEPTSLIGRGTDTQGVIAALRDKRIVVVTGVGGVGKSRLAVRVARGLAEGYRDGVAWCDLVGVEDPGTVPDVVATALGVLPSPSDSARALVELLGGQERLLVLDNCEHVADAASVLVDRIASACPKVDVLVTSRQPLKIASQQLWPLGPLEVDAGAQSYAVELFCDRAVSADPRFDWATADREVVEICRRLDGVPLAIELAAAQTRSMTPADLAARLDDGFELLVEGHGETSGRQRSLQAVLDWSYDLLSRPSQWLFDRLSVFAGGFQLDAAERVCTGEGLSDGDVALRLAELVDHSLVVVDHSGRHARYRLLESLRAYGVAHLEQRGELSLWRGRHAELATSLAEAAAAGIHGSDEAHWVQLLDTEWVNLRAAQGWALASEELDVALRLPALLRDYAYHRLADEVYVWAERALDLPGAAADPTWFAALLTAAVGRMQRGELDRARDDAVEVLAATSDEHLVLRALQVLAEVALYQGRLDDVDRRGDEIVDRACETGSAYFEALGHLYRVHAAAYGGRPEDATAHLDTGWKAAASAGAPSLRAGYCYLEGEIRVDAEPEVALVALRQAIENARVVRNRFLAGVSRVALASSEARHGRPDEALAAFREIIGHWRACGDWVHQWTSLHNLVVLFERVGAEDAAAVLTGAVHTATSGPRPFGAAAERLENTEVALRRSLGETSFASAWALGRGMSDEQVVAFALDQLDLLLAAPADGVRNETITLEHAMGRAAPGSPAQPR